MKRSAVLVSVVVGVGALIVGSSALAARQPEAVRSAQAHTLIASVNVTATEFKFVLSKKTAKRGLVIFKVKNAGKLGHDFQINGRKTPVIPPGKSNTLRVTFLRKGHYAYKCTVPGHAAAGMKGVFTIT
jgi:plastocyanin